MKEQKRGGGEELLGALCGKYEHWSQVPLCMGDKESVGLLLKEKGGREREEWERDRKSERAMVGTTSSHSLMSE